MMAEQSWLQALGLDTILRAFIPIGTAAVAAWGAWKFGGKDQASETREERIQRELDERQASMSKQGAEALTWLREENDRCRQRIHQVEIERDEVSQNLDATRDIARGWNERAHWLKHYLENERMANNGLRMQAGLAPRTWSDERLPPLDQIIEDNARRFGERGSIYVPPDDADTL